MATINSYLKMNYTIFIKDLLIQASIGINEDEKQKLQPLLINIQAKVNKNEIADITDTICYATVADQVTRLIKTEHIDLVETAAIKIKELLTKNFQVQEYMIELQKPEAIPNTKTVGVRLTSDNWIWN